MPSRVPNDTSGHAASGPVNQRLRRSNLAMTPIQRPTAAPRGPDAWPTSLAADELRAVALHHGTQVSGWTASCRSASGKEGEPCPKPWT
jgi:hypothetical protein